MANWDICVSGFARAATYIGVAISKQVGYHSRAMPTALHRSTDILAGRQRPHAYETFCNRSPHEPSGCLARQNVNRRRRNPFLQAYGTGEKAYESTCPPTTLPCTIFHLHCQVCDFHHSIRQVIKKGIN